MSDDPEQTDLEAKVAELTAQLESTQSEMKKVIAQRDKFKGSTRASETERAELEELRQFKAHADEEAQKAAGEWDKLKADATSKVQAAEAKADAAAQALADAHVQMAFYGAKELFGGTDALTSLTPDFALAGFRSQVRFDPGENGTPGRVVVLDSKTGEAITGDDGTPAPFVDAMRRLIDTHPSKGAILRNGGKAGSGTRGGGAEPTPVGSRADLAARAAAGDKEALREFAKTPSRIVSGRRWQRQADETPKAG